ncbi:MAG TPA: glycoside hydrolase family 75 protein [Pyrinomonadaceae bacterium]
MGLDLDGSWKACSCGEKGKTDQCRTTHLWNPPHPTTTEYNRQEDKCVFYKEQAFVDAENIPYMVIPSGEKFNRLTGLKAGDFGIVIYRDKMIPVFVADTGPDFRIGEGSAALLRAVGVDRCKARNEERHCTDYEDSSIEENVLFFIFPNSKSKDLKKENALAVIKEKALKRFEEFKKSLE